jgi:hypothetical protein
MKSTEKTPKKIRWLRLSVGQKINSKIFPTDR